MWHKNFENPIMYSAPSKWYEMEKSYDVDSGGSQRVSIVPVSSVDVNRRQLDPMIVNLDSLIQNGEVIKVGDVANMLSLTDPAQIEEYNTQYTQAAYKFLVENKDKIFKTVESK